MSSGAGRYRPPDEPPAQYWGPQWGPAPYATAADDQAPYVSDAQLRALPPPTSAHSPAPTNPSDPSDQRPAVVGLAVTMAVTASMLWVCGLSFAWVVAIAATGVIGTSGEDGAVFHLLNEFRLRLLDGLVVPLYAFPLASCVSGFLLLVRRPWTRIAHTAVGVVSLGWAAWWLRDSLLTWGPFALYVGVAVAVLWTSAAGRWYGRPRTFS